MGLVLKYVKETAAGTWHYRRKVVPKALIPIIGRRELKRFLGATEREALRVYPAVHAEFEKVLAAAARPVGTHGGVEAVDAYDKARALLQDALAAMGKHGAGGTLRDLYADSAVAAYPLNAVGEPVGMPEAERLYVNALRAGGDVKRPAPSVEDARDLYLKDKIAGSGNEGGKRNRVALVVGLVQKVVGKGKLLAALERPDARAVKDHMLAELGMKPATARRYVNDIRAMITHGITEFGLRGVDNPFVGLEIKVDTVAKDERKPFTEAQIRAVRARLDRSASDDLQRTFRLLEGTGCRLAEITGLMVADVVGLDGERPYIDLVVHPHRGLKTKGSVRRVPLMGDALVAAREAVVASKGSEFLFPAYARSRGADAASQALMKHVRATIGDPKVVIHSLRHTMKDRLIAAGVSGDDGSLLLGHSKGDMGDRYGGPEGRLTAASRALKAAMRL